MENKTRPVIGGWYTQYSAGFWQLIDLKPKYADSDHSGEAGSWKKGDRLGDWAIVKKAFTPKLKKSLRVECVDSAHLKEVPSEIAAAICDQLDRDPKYREKFNAAGELPEPYISNLWLKLSDREAAELTSVIGTLPGAFTMEQLAELLPFDLCAAAVKPGDGCNFLLDLLLYPWELTENFDPIFCGAELRPLGRSRP